MIIARASTLLLGLGLAFTVFSCKKAEGSGDGGSNPADPNPQAVGWRGNRSCTTDNDCAGATGVLCTQFVTAGPKCDTSIPSNKVCLIKLVSGAQCAEGHTRGATLAGNAAVLTCNTSTCDWRAGVACGGAGQPCCVGGCSGGRTCSSIVGATGSTCSSP